MRERHALCLCTGVFLATLTLVTQANPQSTRGSGRGKTSLANPTPLAPAREPVV